MHYWLEHFFGDRIDLVAEDQHAFAFGTANATIDPSQLPDAQPNEARTYWLVPELPFIFSDGHPAVELGDPDSFIDIIDGKTRSIYRVVSVGTPGLLANAFWVAPLRFAVIFVDYLPGSDQPGNTYLTCYDLGTWSSERFSPAAPPKPLDRDAVDAYLIRTHHP